MTDSYGQYETNKIDTSDIVRLKITDGNGGETRWISITPDTFAKIAEVLHRAPETQW